MPWRPPSPKLAPPSNPSHDEAPSLLAQSGPAGILAIVSMIFPVVGSILLFWAMAATGLGPWLRGHGALGAAGFAAAFAVLAGIALLPTYAQCALAGWAFGVSTGLLASMVGFVVGAMIGYAVGRRAAGERVEAILQANPKALAVREAFLGPSGVRPSFWRTLGLVTLLRLPPNSPFALTNLVMASVRVPLLPYALGTLIGMTPRSAIAVMIGAMIQQSFSKETLAAAAPPWLWWTAQGSALVVVLLLGNIAKRAVERQIHKAGQ